MYKDLVDYVEAALQPITGATSTQDGYYSGRTTSGRSGGVAISIADTGTTDAVTTAEPRPNNIRT